MMGNKAWYKLTTEWSSNKYNDYFISLCKANDVPYDDIRASKTEAMLAIRKECKANYIWLEDFAEKDLYIALMPFGGHTAASIKQLKEVIKEYRNSGRRNRVYLELLEKYEV